MNEVVHGTPSSSRSSKSLLVGPPSPTNLLCETLQGANTPENNSDQIRIVQEYSKPHMVVPLKGDLDSLVRNFIIWDELEVELLLLHNKRSQLRRYEHQFIKPSWPMGRFLRTSQQKETQNLMKGYTLTAMGTPWYGGAGECG